MNRIAADNTTKVIRLVFTHSNEPVVTGEYQRDISPAEFTAIDTIHRNGGVAVDDVAGIRAATVDEADDRKTFKQALLGRISLVGNVANRSPLYAPANDILLALDNRDKDGAKAIVDTVTSMPVATRTKLKSLIDRIAFQ